MATTQNPNTPPFEGVEIFDPLFEVTFTFGEQISEVDGEPVYATFADGKPWSANFTRSTIEAMLWRAS